MANAKVISMIDHAIVTAREQQLADLEIAFVHLHGELRNLGAKLDELRYEVEELKRERDSQ